MTLILYVCRYNIDRSPLAVLMTKSRINNSNNKDRTKDVIVTSAGLDKPSDHFYSKMVYLGMTRIMRIALEKEGYTPPAVHDVQQTTKDILDKADIILCMKDKHVKKILSKENSLEGKIYTLPEYAGFKGEEIYSPSRLIKKVPLFHVLNCMPNKVKKQVYDGIGFTDPRDTRGVLEIHKKLIRQTKFYVGKALERMVEEGLVLKEQVLQG